MGQSAAQSSQAGAWKRCLGRWELRAASRPRCTPSTKCPSRTCTYRMRCVINSVHVSMNGQKCLLPAREYTDGVLLQRGVGRGTHHQMSSRIKNTKNMKRTRGGSVVATRTPSTRARSLAICTISWQRNLSLWGQSRRWLLGWM